MGALRNESQRMRNFKAVGRATIVLLLRFFSAEHTEKATRMMPILDRRSSTTSRFANDEHCVYYQKVR